MTKRFLAIVTVLMLALTSVVAFAEADTTETASVDWTEPYAETVDVHIAIEEPANAVFAEGEDYSNNLWTKRWKELYNVNVIVDWVSNEYDTKMNLSIASNTLPDIYKVNAVQFSQLKQAGSLQDLTETYNTYASDSIKTMMENNWDIVETAMEGDQILAMPRLHYGYECETTQIWARSDWMEQSGVTEFTSVDDVVNVMKGFQENNSASYGIMLDKSLDCFFRSAVMFHALPKIWVEGEDGSLVYGSVQPEMKEALSTWAQWYQDGLIMADAISNTQEGSSMVTAGAAFATLHNADIDPLETLYPNTVSTSEFVSPRAIPTDIGNLQYGISANSAHPEEAFTLLSALYTDAKLHTLLSYGIEGKHYVINEDGRADYPEGMTAETEPYGGFAATATYPNYLLNPLKATAVVDDYKAAVDEWNNKVKVSRTFGFYFDTTEYGDFLTAYKNLEEKYMHSIKTGSVALDDVLPTIQSELEAIGFYDMLAKVQEELDAYLAQQ